MVMLINLYSCKGPVYLEPFAASEKAPRNVILVIADGMGAGQLTGAAFLKRRDKIISRFPVVGFQKTYASDDLITDSAASATAMSCGVKTYVGAVGVNADTVPVTNLVEKARDIGKATGIVVSSSIVHGTPACFYAHQPTRLDLETIAMDLLSTSPDFVVGGGKYYFTARRDDRNLVKELEDQDYQVYDFFNRDLVSLHPDHRSKFLYFTAEREPLGAHFGRRFLPVAVNKAITYLKKRSSKGFFLVIEASQVDWACHNRSSEWLYSELQDLRSVLAEVIRFAQKDKNTLVILTGDHETGGASINKKSNLGFLKFEFASNDHSGEMIPVLSMGPGARNFSGIFENTEIHHKITKLWNPTEQ